MSSIAGSVTITPKGFAWHRRGHLWIYRDDLADADQTLAGEIVEVYDLQRHRLGIAFFNPRSKIALRMIATDGAVPDATFWRARLADAIERRRPLADRTNGMRLVSSEADLCPGLIVDRYNDVLVIQTLCLGIDRIKSFIIESLVELVKPRCIVVRNDASVRAFEGLDPVKQVPYGEQPDHVEIHEGDVRLLVDVWDGQKTGLYLDQRDNRLAAAQYASGEVLDCFAYQGGFALHAARRAARVTALESSGPALQMLRANVALNRLENITPEEANAFDTLKVYEQRDRRFQMVILDPPAFAKAKGDIADAARGYGQLNTRALRILEPGGYLVTCSCSHNLSEEKFLQILQRAASEAQRQVRIIEHRLQPPDHPILLSTPETHYLKCFVLQAI